MGSTAPSLSLFQESLDSGHIVIVSNPIDYPSPDGAMIATDAGLSPAV